MIVPRHWAQARLQERIRGKQVTLLRYGWSNASPQEAQRMADERVREALERVRRGETPTRRERKVPYNGADGLPIREEIVSEHGEAVVTRNSYGARCLNVPDVLIADVDFEQPLTGRGMLLVLLLAVATLVGVSALTRSVLVACPVAMGLLVVGALAARGLKKVLTAARGGDERIAQGRVAAFSRRNPAWRLHLYRTPRGLRVVATHRRFDATEPEVARMFEALKVDPLYRKMCLLQRCFRARLTAKPWRIGIAAHLKPRPGTWPVNPARLPQRQAWLAKYDAAAEGYAACRFLESLGSAPDDPAAHQLRKLHDDLCRAHSGLPLA